MFFDLPQQLLSGAAAVVRQGISNCDSSRDFHIGILGRREYSTYPTEETGGLDQPHRCQEGPLINQRAVNDALRLVIELHKVESYKPWSIRNLELTVGS